ncbi:YitT family protein [Paenibacillus apiarius]|uniref:YitT family protein n=1 Tax=Paenibacillus apiarius TaxID=46240 RepID=A0ABT4DVV0_9BACL|nr:YitT family protein [Paenibacillus apiarius]MBN3527587.1 YitT family protein [Paenibacillus apiarius]MCY9517075.1 YitT family protein [Paenibacillus apiarius]MCY9520228.1 YitT family protein [Paenibacillus apiarius]MCY9554884.1 YitT family protein [Paenibacillus apiarius]MCY9561395.1 YitT family protein [Paenibacillus apiarius]
MKSSLFQRVWQTFLPITLGTAVYAFGLIYFIIPNQLMEGGVTGVTVLLNYAAGIQPSLSTLLLNIPLFAIGWRALGSKQMVYSVYGVLSLTLFLWLFEQAVARHWIIPFQTEHDFILATLYAGVTLGTGLGIVFRFGGTTGGVDILARMANRRLGISMGQFILFLDIFIIGAALFYIPKEKILYTLVAVFISSKMIDFIQEGAYAAKAFTVITDHSDQIADIITQEMERGVTLVPVIGAYSREPKQMVYCVVSRTEIRRFKTLVKEIDPRAFIVVNDVHDVLGEGFREE